MLTLPGALAGHRLPPLMELAWIQQIERGGIESTSTGTAGAGAGAGGSPATGRRRLIFDKIKCYILFKVGLVVGLVGPKPWSFLEESKVNTIDFIIVTSDEIPSSVRLFVHHVDPLTVAGSGNKDSAARSVEHTAPDEHVRIQAA